MKIQIKENQLVDLYFVQDKSYSQIAEIFNCSKQTICNRFKEFNLVPRNKSESLTNRKHYWGNKIAKALKGKKRPGIGGAKKGSHSWNKGLRKATSEKLKNTGNLREKHWNWK